MKIELVHSYSSNSLANLSHSISDPGNKKNISGQTNLAFEDEYSASNTNSKNYLNGLPVSKDNGTNNSTDIDCFTGFCRTTFRKKLLLKRCPILGWSKEYTKAKLLADIIAGVTTGLTLIPQGLIYAQIAGLPPQYGLYSGFVGCLVYIIFGTSKVVGASVGPTAILSIVTYSYIQGKPQDYAIFLALASGIVTLLMGIFQLGFITNFISIPVLSGFTSAASLVICSTQIKSLLGLSFKATGFRETVLQTSRHFGEIQYEDAILSVVCSFVLILLQNLQCIFGRFSKNNPKAGRILWFVSTSRSVIVILICTLVVSLTDKTNFHVKVVGDIIPGLPPVRVPPCYGYLNVTGEMQEFSFPNLLINDLSALIILPMLALMEHITSAKKFCGTTMVDSSQEMIAIGISNIVGSFFCSMPVTGSLSRTSVNAASGAATPLAGLFTGALILLALQFLTPYFYFIPNASLASVIVCAMLFTIDFQIVIDIWKSKRMDIIPWALTFSISLCCGLPIGILCGVSISVIFLLYYAARPAVRIQRAQTSCGNEFVIVGLDRSLVYPSIEYCRYVVLKARNVWAITQKGLLLPVVIDCQHIQFADFSAAQGIRDLFTTFNSNHHSLILWRAKPSIIRILKSVLQNSGVPFQFASSEEELELIIDEERSGTKF